MKGTKCMEKIEILKMTLQDFEQIEKNLISDFDDFWTPAILKSEIVAENRSYIVAKQNGEIVGFAGVMYNFPAIEIMNIVTKKDCRGNGIGKKLLQAILENAEKNQFTEIFLEVNEKNKIAKSLYENAGFCQIGERKTYYGDENAILMAKKA